MAGKGKFFNAVTAIFNEEDIDVPFSVFKVPSSMTSTKPEAFVPQTVSLGPVHYSSHELQQMQMYKVMQAKRIHNGFQSGFEFVKVIEFLEQLVGGPSVRASYCIYFDMEDDDLACVMVVDGLFLFDLLCYYGIEEEDLANSSSLCHLVNSTGQRLAQETIIQEAMMLENQIPISVMKVLLIIECLETTTASELFPTILLGFCKFISPLTTLENYPWYEALKHPHLLDLLYHLVTLQHSPEWNDEEEEEELKSLEELSNKVRPSKMVSESAMEGLANQVGSEKEECIETGQFKQATDRNLSGEETDLEMPDEIVPNLLEAAQRFAPQQFLLPLRLIKSLYGKLPQYRSILSSATKKEVPAKKISSFPTASKLHSVGVKFHAVDRITDISFDSEEACFNLPFITLNANFEVVIRNLVAYEALVKSEEEPRILNWYVELMNGLIKTAKDVEVLRDQRIISKPESIHEEPESSDDKQVTEGISSEPVSNDEERATAGISSELESFNDEQVAKIFSGMNKLIELTNIPKNLEEAVRSVKGHHARRLSELESKFMVKFRRNAAKSCKLLLVLLALFLLTVQTVCSVYECPRFSFKTSNSSPIQQGLQLPSSRSHPM